MPLEKDGSGAAYRANQTLKDALDAQLSLFGALLPLQGWLISQRRQGEFHILSAQGAWRQGDLTPAAELMQGQWAALPEHPGFHYRHLSSTEQPLVADLLPSGATPDYVLRRPLRDIDGYVRAWLLGLAPSQALGATSDLNFPVDSVQLALSAISLTLSLHTDFSRVNDQLSELQHNAFIEPLTGILNRAGWTNRVEHLQAMIDRTEEDVAIIMLDLDMLKVVNDMQGHSAGDELLQLTAKTIESVLRSGDVVGRLGGDEFGVAVKGVNPILADAVIRRLRTALDNVDVKVSMGMALKSEAGTLSDALGMADERMYQDKRSKQLAEPDSWYKDPAHSVNQQVV